MPACRTTLGADFINFGRVRREDSGNYQVSAEDSVGTGNALLTLEVYCENYLLFGCVVYDTY